MWVVKWDRIRQQETSNDRPSHIGKQIGLGDCLQVSEANPQRISVKIMATAAEAVIGAVYVDGNLKAVPKVMDHLGIKDGGQIDLLPYWCAVALICGSLKQECCWHGQAR